MKNIKLIIILLLIPFLGSAQYALQNTLRKFKNDNGVSSMKFNGEAFVENAKRKDNQPLKSQIDFIDLYLVDGGEGFSPEKLTKIDEALTKDNFEMLINAKSKEGHLSCFVLEKEGVLNQAYANIMAEGKTFYAVVSGSFYFEELALLDLNFEGSNIMKYFDK